MAFVMIAAAWISLHLRLRRDTHQHAGLDARSFVDDALGGMRELRSEPGAPLLLLVGGSQFFLIGLLDVFYALLAIDLLAVGSSGAGALAAGYGVGGLVGATVAVVLAGRRRLSVAMLGGLVASGATLAAVGFAGSLAGAFMLLVACGAARSFFDVAARTLLQRAVREDVLARVFGLEEALQMGGLAVGSATAPFLVSRFGPKGRSRHQVCCSPRSPLVRGPGCARSTRGPARRVPSSLCSGASPYSRRSRSMSPNVFRGPDLR